MSLSTRWHRLEAARWVHRLVVLDTALLGLATAGTLVAALPAGKLWVVLLPLSLTALTGWLAQAWGRERRWTWWAVMTLAVLDTLMDLLQLASGPSFLTLWHLLLDAALLALLEHPDSRARLNEPSSAPQPPPPTPSWRQPSR